MTTPIGLQVLGVLCVPLGHKLVGEAGPTIWRSFVEHAEISDESIANGRVRFSRQLTSFDSGERIAPEGVAEETVTTQGLLDRLFKTEELRVAHGIMPSDEDYFPADPEDYRTPFYRLSIGDQKFLQAWLDDIAHASVRGGGAARVLSKRLMLHGDIVLMIARNEEVFTQDLVKVDLAHQIIPEER